MKRSVSTALLLTLALFTRLGASAQESVRLSHKATAGQTARYKSEGKITLEAGGMKIEAEVKEVEKVTIVSVDASGVITREDETESSETLINGQKVPTPEEKNKNTIVMKADGTLVSYKSTRSEEEGGKLGPRMFATTVPIFPDTAVSVGTKWTKEIKGDNDLGTRDAKVDYEVLGFEKVNGVDTVKIKLNFEEKEGSPKVTARATLFVDKASGDTVRGEFEIDNLPLPGASGSGKLTSERIEGSPLKSPSAQAASNTTEKKPEPKKEKNIDETVKDGFEKIPGQFTLYRKKEAGRETIYMEIKEAQLNKNLMLQATAGSGTSDRIVSGDPINDLLFRFVKIGDDRLFMIVPNYNFRAEEKTPIAASVQRSFASSILESFKIEAKQEDRKSILINVSDLFRGDIAQISAVFSGPSLPIPGMGGGGGYSLDRDKTYLLSIKNFPENLVVETSYNFNRSGGGSPISTFLGGASVLPDPRSATFHVVYNLFQLPENNYRPRHADPRVGYFLTEYQDFTRDGKEDLKVRYIYRWHLEKSDPGAPVSTPKQPIVFWLDNAIPVEYRDAVRDGILRWNKAFEKIGYKEAIVVKQMPENADWSHADMRYNTIRWVTSPNSAYAVALFRVNPITGQILNASITVDAGIVNFTKIERRVFVEPAAWFAEDSPENVAKRALKRKHRHHTTGLACADCDMMEYATEQAWFGQMALSMLAPTVSNISEKEYTLAFIRDVVAHEMGHILGLRHNFLASTVNSLEQLSDPQRVKQYGVAASVMDYTPFNIGAIRHKNVDYFNSSIGPYDMWAIEYGYTPLSGSKPDDERFKLSQIASKTNQPGLAYQSDEIADQFDPLVTRFDLGRDPLAYWLKHMQMTRFLIFNLDKRQPRKGESYWEFTRDFYRLINVYARGAAVASRYIGGLHVNRNFKGDPGEKAPLVPASMEDQRRALDLLNTYIFAEGAFRFPAKYYTKLTSNPNMDFATAFTASQDYPVRDTFASIQRAALQRIFRADVLGRVVNNEFKVGSPDKALTLPYLYRSVGANIWSELEGRRNIDTLRRQLQRVYLDTMIGMVTNPTASAPEDAKMLAWDQLRRLRRAIQSAQSDGKYDTYTQVHLEESLMRVNRALEARQMIGGVAPSRVPSLLEQLLGGQQQ
jgi:hypothetical protein